MFRIFCLAVFVLILPYCSSGQQPKQPPLQITRLAPDCYVYTTWGEHKGERYPANGMYLVTNSGVVLFDSPWDTTQFAPLLDSIAARHQQQVVLCLATHFHEDRTAGLEYYRSRGIATYTTRMTDSLSAGRGFKRAQFLIDRDTTFTIGQYSFQTYYPGRGHAPDNIVIWFEKEKILYGGCLIKSTEDGSLGNLADASRKDYAATVRRVIRHCKAPRHIVTGHNSWLDTGSLRHTLRLAEKLQWR